MRLGNTTHLTTWFRHLLFFYREDIFRKLTPIMVVVALYALIIVYLDRSWNLFNKLNHLNLGQFHLIFSFILAILIGFRVNTSYARWWEGRMLWGSLVNNCRNLALKFDTFAGLNNYPEFYANLCALPMLLKYHLRKDHSELHLKCQKLGIANQDQPLLFLIQQMYVTINDLRQQQKLSLEQYSALDMHLVNLIDIVGGCERIANTPVPIAFAFFVKQALLFYALIFPIGWADKFGYWIVPVMLMIVYLLLGLELLAEELEEPFGVDENDLPLEKITQNLLSNLKNIAQRT